MARILLVERDERIRGFIAGILSEFGHQVAECADAAVAYAWLAREPFDVMLTDLLLCSPQAARFGGGCAALGVPTLTLSGQEFRAGEKVERQQVRFLDKPFRFADLQGILDAVASYSGPSRGTVRTAA
jgi:DNA-binding NtrC family response regulator